MCNNNYHYNLLSQTIPFCRCILLSREQYHLHCIVRAVLLNDLLHIIPGMSHSMFRKMRLNPLWNWDKEKAAEWIISKKKDFVKFRGAATEMEEDSDDDEYIVTRTKYRGAAAEMEDDCDEDDTEVDNEYPTMKIFLH